MKFLWLVATALVLTACAGTGGGLNAVTKTNDLVPGMTVPQVKNLLGDPSQTQFVGDKMVWKYSLHEPWKGFIPYYLIFAGEPLSLQRWYADEAEFIRQQRYWMQAFPPPQTQQERASGSEPSSNSNIEACLRKYTTYEDRRCYCYNVC